MNDDLALAIRIAKDTRSAVSAVDYHLNKLLDRDGGKPRRDGSLIIRMAACQLISVAYKQPVAAVARQFWPDDVQLKAAVAPARTDTTGWAAELVATVVAEIPDRLLPASVFSRLRAAGLPLDYGGDSVPKVPYVAPVPSGGFVGEGQPINVGALVVTASTLPVKKCASLTAVTRELLRGAPANIERSLETILSEDLSLMVDGILLDAGAADAIRPAGLRNGVAGLTPSATGTPTERLMADLKALTAAIAPAMRPVLIVAGTQAVSLSLLAPTLPFIPAPYLAASTVIMVDAAAFASVTGTLNVRTSEEAVIHMSNAAQPIGTPGAVPGTDPNVVAAPSSSMWQTASFALRCLLDVNWTMRRAGAVSWITGVTW